MVAILLSFLVVGLLGSVRTDGFVDTGVRQNALPSNPPAVVQRPTTFATTTTVRPMLPMPVWPYLGCSGSCGGGPLGLFVTLAFCGTGLPLSEDVLLIGLAPRLFVPGASALHLRSKLLYVLATVGGTAVADTLTVGIGRAIRVNAGVWGEQAPGFVQRMLVAIRQQLVVESQRDQARLTEQIETRLRIATINLGEQVRALVASIDTTPGNHEEGTNNNNNNKDATSGAGLSTWQRLAASNTWLRRITCNNRTSLAAWGQTAVTLTTIVASRSRRSPASMQTHHTKKKRASVSSVSTTAESCGAGIDNRLALGQRWPLALLSGFSTPPLEYGPYFRGAALAAGTVTLPVQLVMGAALQTWSRRVCYGVIALAQLCRYGPIWATVVVAISDTVKVEIHAAKKKKKKKK